MSTRATPAATVGPAARAGVASASTATIPSATAVAQRETPPNVIGAFRMAAPFGRTSAGDDEGDGLDFKHRVRSSQAPRAAIMHEPRRFGAAPCRESRFMPQPESPGSPSDPDPPPHAAAAQRPGTPHDPY